MKKSKLARVDLSFLELIKESGMTAPSYTRRLAEQIRRSKEEEVVRMKPKGWGFKL